MPVPNSPQRLYRMNDEGVSENDIVTALTTRLHVTFLTRPQINDPEELQTAVSSIIEKARGQLGDGTEFTAEYENIGTVNSTVTITATPPPPSTDS